VHRVRYCVAAAITKMIRAIATYTSACGDPSEEIRDPRDVEDRAPLLSFLRTLDVERDSEQDDRDPERRDRGRHEREPGHGRTPAGRRIADLCLLGSSSTRETGRARRAPRLASAPTWRTAGRWAEPQCLHDPVQKVVAVTRWGKRSEIRSPVAARPPRPRASRGCIATSENPTSYAARAARPPAPTARDPGAPRVPRRYPGRSREGLPDRAMRIRDSSRRPDSNRGPLHYE
jgi:hypothetical protein